MVLDFVLPGISDLVLLLAELKMIERKETSKEPFLIIKYITACFRQEMHSLEKACSWTKNYRQVGQLVGESIAIQGWALNLVCWETELRDTQNNHAEKAWL